MAKVDGIVRRLDKALTKTQALDTKVYKRFVTRTGGDSLIGRYGSSSMTETLLDPQPIYGRLGRNVVGDAAPSQAVLADNATRIAVDYQIILSPTAITTAELDNDQLLIVMKDGRGNENIYHLTDYEPVAFNNKDVMYIGYIRSAART